MAADSEPSILPAATMSLRRTDSSDSSSGGFSLRRFSSFFSDLAADMSPTHLANGQTAERIWREQQERQTQMRKQMQQSPSETNDVRRRDARLQPSPLSEMIQGPSP